MRETLKFLETIVKSHKSIKGVYVDPLSVVLGKTINYTAAIIEILNISYNRLERIYNVRITIIDKLNVDNSNYKDVIADCEEIANDIHSVISSKQYSTKLGIDILNENVSLVADKLKDNVAGVVYEFSFYNKANYKEQEELPFKFSEINKLGDEAIQ